MEPVEALGVDEIDLSDMEFWRRPYAEREGAFATLRRERPIAHFDDPVIEGTTVAFPPGHGYWALTRHHDLAEVSRNPQVFLSGPGAVSLLDLPAEMVEYFSGMISTDNPRHARLRRIVANAFNPRTVRAVEDSIERLADEIIERACRTGTGDFVDDVAAPFPLEIIGTMMGVPPSEYPTVLRCSNVILSNGDPTYIPEGADPVLAILEAGATLTALMEELGKDRVERPGDDLTSALVNAEIESEKLTQQELASFFVLLLAAGNETTRTALAHGLVALSDHPGERARLVEDFAGLSATVADEMVRWASPVIWMRRTLAEDYVLSGVELAAGDKVVLYYSSANRDEAVFGDPFTFDVGRTPNDHYGFGAPGLHFCLGAHLARREITVMWRELLARAPAIRATAPPVKLESSFINGVVRLPYAF
jgi:methyl-branched lipid omega-hydroxylase